METIRTERPMGNRWVILWVASVALLRAVGHALKKVDATSDWRLELAVDEAWECWSSQRDEHHIFWDFIEDARNNILKEFELGAGQGVTVRPGADHTVTYPVYLEGFGVQDQAELLDRALDWWQKELEKIEAPSLRDRSGNVTLRAFFAQQCNRSPRCRSALFGEKGIIAREQGYLGG